MTVSYLILAHGNLIHLDRLINQLSDENSRIYIHLDQRVACPPHLQQKQGVYFIPDPLKVYWGGFSQVQAILKLLRHAINDQFGDYYALISGTDFPVKNKVAFYKQLAQGGEFISMIPADTSRRSLRYLFYHFEKFERRKYWLPYNAFFHFLEMIIKVVYPKRYPSFKLFYGPTWFILSKKCVSFILQQTDGEKHFTDFFKNTLSSDEAFFHSIIANSPFMAETRPNLTYTYWPTNMEPGPITEKQVNILKNNSTFTSKYGTYTPFFARKFNDSSKAVIEQIKRELY